MIEEDITDIVAILRECADNSRKTEGDYYADQYAIAAEVFDEAANLIERLRNEVARQRLTGAEREAIREACDEGRWYPKDFHHIHTLRRLLERLKWEPVIMRTRIITFNTPPSRISRRRFSPHGR